MRFIVGLALLGCMACTAHATPTLSSCGITPTITGDDFSGEIVTGDNDPTTCTMAFSKPHPSGVCTVRWRFMQPPMLQGSYRFTNASTIVMEQMARSHAKIMYRCLPHKIGG